MKGPGHRQFVDVGAVDEIERGVLRPCGVVSVEGPVATGVLGGGNRCAGNDEHAYSEHVFILSPPAPIPGRHPEKHAGMPESLRSIRKPIPRSDSTWYSLPSRRPGSVWSVKERFRESRSP